MPVVRTAVLVAVERCSWTCCGHQTALAWGFCNRV